MIIELSKGLSIEDIDALQWEEVEVVKHTSTTAAGLAKELVGMQINYPSSAFDENGDFCWDYKDSNLHTFNVLSQIASAIEGLLIVGQSEGPRYWFISFIFNGEEGGIGPGYKSK